MSAMDTIANTTGNDTNRTGNICSKLPWEGLHYDFGESWFYVFDFAFFGVFVSLIGLLGLVGNILSILVLRRGVISSFVTPYLLWLAICDIFSIFTHLLLLFAVGYKSVFDVQYICEYVHPYFQTYNVYFVRVSQTTVGFLTCAIAASRYFAIQNPMSARIWISSRFAKIMSTAITVGSLLMCISVLFKYDVGSCFHAGVGKFIYYRRKTSLVTPIVSKVESIAHSVITVYVPWTFVAMFNCLLIRRLWQARMARRSLAVGAKQRDRTNKTTLLLLGLTITYLVLYFPAVIDLNINLFVKSTYRYNVCATPYDMDQIRIASAFKVLKLFNSCVNVIFYYIFGTRFRERMLYMLKPGRRSGFESE